MYSVNETKFNVEHETLNVLNYLLILLLSNTVYSIMSQFRVINRSSADCLMPIID